LSSPISLAGDPRFRRFWTGQTVSEFGDRVSELALPLIATATLHAGGLEVSCLTAVAWGPHFAAIFVGGWVDRRPDKRRLLVTADLVRAAVLLSLPIASLTGHVTLTQLYAVAVITGAAAVLFDTSYPTFFTRLVPRAAYLDANSKLNTTRSASYVAGPALGGTLIQALGAPLAVIADAASFLTSALFIGRIRPMEPEPSTTPEAEPEAQRAPTTATTDQKPDKPRIRDGLHYIRRHPILRATLASAATVNYFTFLAGTGLLVLYATRTLHLTSATLGAALGIGALGGLAGALLAPRIARRIGIGPAIATGAVLFPAPLALIATAHGPTWTEAATLALAELLSAAGVMLFDVNLNALQAAVIADDVRGRVAGAYRTVNYGVRPLGALTGGVLANVWGLRPTLLIAAIGGAMSVLWLVFSPVRGVRTLD
jgi:predicted MFS family arabinose efflux permease